MTTTASAPPTTSGGLIARALALACGTVAYTIFLDTFLYAIGFAGRFMVPKLVNSGLSGPPLYAVTVNLVLLGLFAIRHSGAARRKFKQSLSRLVPP